MNATRRSRAGLLAGLLLLLAPACSTVASWVPGGPERIPNKLDADEVPHALEAAQHELDSGDSERALDWMRAAAQATGLPSETRERVRSEERRVGKECPVLCRSRWSPYH